VREEELLPDEIDPEVPLDDPLEPAPAPVLGEQDEQVLAEEWEEAAREGGV
jgi:hypothetical protein